MPQTYPRICCLLILALASSSCGADSGSSTNPSQAPATATLTEFALPPESTPTPSAVQSVNPEEPSNATLTLTVEAPGNSTPMPPPATSNTPIPLVHPVGPLCNDSMFVDDVTIPDGTVVKPEEEFVKTWRFKNTGTCRWTTSYAIGFSHGHAMSGTKTKNVLPNSVDPGYTVDVSIKMTAPKDNGWYGGWWRLRNEAGDYFGDFVFVSILVSDGTETTTPVPS